MYKKFYYLAFTPERVRAISSTREVDVNNKSQIAWVERLCNGEKPIGLFPVTKENGCEELSKESMKKYIIWIE